MSQFNSNTWLETNFQAKDSLKKKRKRESPLFVEVNQVLHKLSILQVQYNQTSAIPFFINVTLIDTCRFKTITASGPEFVLLVIEMNLLVWIIEGIYSLIYRLINEL